MSARTYRAFVQLHAKIGHEKALLDFCLEAAPKIRQVDGLHRFEINRALQDPGRLMLYYEWATPEHSAFYVAGPLYKALMPELMAMVDDHSLLMTENVAG